jgi:hypothetical protein
MLFMYIGMVRAATTTEIDFDEAQVTGEIFRPAVALIVERIPWLCPSLDPSSVEWQECVLNLDYTAIKEVCSDLGAGTAELTRRMSTLDVEYFPVWAREGDQQTWHGCFFNSRTGVRVQEFVWTFVGNRWFMTDVPHDLAAVSKTAQGSLNAFDGYAWVEDSERGRPVDINATMAYRLDPVAEIGASWAASTSGASQSSINAHSLEQGVQPPYCSPGEKNMRCQPLPRLLIRAVGSNILSVRTVGTVDEEHAVYGVLFRAMTTFDYTASTQTKK